jgi:hypothetical protein
MALKDVVTTFVVVVAVDVAGGCGRCESLQVDWFGEDG